MEPIITNIIIFCILYIIVAIAISFGFSFLIHFIVMEMIKLKRKYFPSEQKYITLEFNDERQLEDFKKFISNPEVVKMLKEITGKEYSDGY